MSVPSDLLYSKDHEWIRVVGSVARVGITDFAQDALGDVVFVQAPEVGSKVSVGQSFSEVESTKSVSDIYAPVSGIVSLVNASLVADPSLLNSDPYGAGWICEITVTDAVDSSQLLTSDEYSALIGS
ncbi:MAG: glycine cleavage system protein GcvH [Actinobacteria bacterium]|nr:glycine cleavage system protein GcvH [Actinomycetota bacterium]